MIPFRGFVMANKDDKMFRSHLGGFNRKDVNNYIKETDMNHSAQLEELTAQLGDAAAQLEESKNALEAANNQKECLIESVSMLSDKAEKLAAENAELTEETTALKSAKLNLAKENASLKEMISSLQVELEAAKAALADDTQKNAASAVPATTFDKVRSRLGIQQNGTAKNDANTDAARAQAQRMLANTERECEAKRAECDAAVAKIRSQTEEQAQFIRDRLAKTAGSFLTNVSADLNESIESCIREINACVSDMESEIKILLAKMSSRSDEMNSRITYYQNYLSDGIEETMTRIGRKSDGERKDG